MYKGFLAAPILLWSIAASAADPFRDGETTGRAEARQALRETQANANGLQTEIERLPRSTGEPPLNVNVRVRLIEVSLTKIQNLGLDLPTVQALGLEIPGNHEAKDTDALFAPLIKKRIARQRADEVLTVADGCQARLHTGTESMSTQVAGESAESDRTFRGTSIAVNPRWQRDGRLLIELVSREASPIFQPGEDPQTKVHEITTMVEVPPGKAIVLKGRKEQRVESSSRGVIGVPALRRVTNTINEIQTLIVVSREPRLAARPVTPARVR